MRAGIDDGLKLRVIPIHMTSKPIADEAVIKFKGKLQCFTMEALMPPRCLKSPWYEG